MLIIGILIGLLLGLTGAGGSVFAVPLLIIFCGFNLNEATGISLGAVAASTIFASASQFFPRNQHVKKQILWLPGIVLTISGILLAPSGRLMSEKISPNILVAAFALLASVIALRMWISAKQTPENSSVVRASSFADTVTPELLCRLNASGQFEIKWRCVIGLMAGGCSVGVLSGLFGVGGGFLIVPLLMTLSLVNIRQAVSTSLFSIALISSSGFISYVLLAQDINWSHLGLISLGGIAGMLLGKQLSHQLAGANLQKIFSIGLLILSAVLIIKLWLDS